MRSRLGGKRGAVVLIAVALIAVLTVAGAAASDDRPSGDEVLNDTRARYANAESVVGVAEVTVRNGTHNATATVEFVAAKNGSRVVVTTDNATYRAGTNDTVAWYVGPNRSRAWEHDALRERLEAAHNASNVTDPAALANRSDGDGNLSVELLREGTDDGTPAYVVRIAPENESRDGRATLWIAKNDSRVLRAEFTDGTNTTVIDYRETRFNVSVHESTFAPPSDRLAVTTYTRYDGFGALQANTTVDLPTFEPAVNASFDTGTVLTRAEGTVVTQEYRVDNDTVTVVSTTIDREFNQSAANTTTVTVNGHPANVTTVRDRAVVYWRTDGVTTAVVTQAGEDRAVELARALEED